MKPSGLTHRTPAAAYHGVRRLAGSARPARSATTGDRVAIASEVDCNLGRPGCHTRHDTTRCSVTFAFPGPKTRQYRHRFDDVSDPGDAGDDAFRQSDLAVSICRLNSSGPAGWLDAMMIAEMGCAIRRRIPLGSGLHEARSPGSSVAPLCFAGGRTLWVNGSSRQVKIAAAVALPL